MSVKKEKATTAKELAEKKELESKQAVADTIVDDLTDIFSGKAEKVEEPPDPEEYDPDAVPSKSWGKTFGEAKAEEKSEAKAEEKLPSVAAIMPPSAMVGEAAEKYIKEMEAKKLEAAKAAIKKLAESPMVPMPAERAENGIITTERRYFIPKESEPTKYETKTLKTPVMRFLTTPAKVGVKYGATLNMGNYETVRVDISIEMPCYKEDIDEVYGLIADYADSLISEHVDEIRASIASPASSGSGSGKRAVGGAPIDDDNDDDKPW